MSKSRSGFRSGHSTETALTLMTDRWLKAINEYNIIGIVMVNFRKAFDLVDHSLLLKKPGLYKCSEEFIKVLKSYLSHKLKLYLQMVNHPVLLKLLVVSHRDLC